MTIALIGASGYVGSAILHEALWRDARATISTQAVSRACSLGTLQ
jgi:putative NADH-flavin reductase